MNPWKISSSNVDTSFCRSYLYFYGVSVARPLNSGATYAMNAPMPLMIA